MAEIFSSQTKTTHVAESIENKDPVDSGNLQAKQQTQEPKVASFGGMDNTSADAGGADTNFFTESNPKGP